MFRDQNAAWIAIAGPCCRFPNIALVYGAHQWTEAVFGFGAPHRLRRCRGVIAIRAAQHGAAADAHRVLCAARPPRHLVRADGFADEHRAGGVAVQTKYLNDIFVVGRSHTPRSVRC